MNILFDDHEIQAALRNLQHHTDNLKPALKAIGEELRDSTQRRFATITGPDGVPWMPDSVLSTLLSEHKIGDRPLTNYGTLGDTITSQLLGNDAVAIGSPLEYAAMMQFGGTQAEFPHLWGDIPARPFLGISDADETKILDIIQQHLEG